MNELFMLYVFIIRCDICTKFVYPQINLQKRNDRKMSDPPVKWYRREPSLEAPHRRLYSLGGPEWFVTVLVEKLCVLETSNVLIWSSDLTV